MAQPKPEPKRTTTSRRALEPTERCCLTALLWKELLQPLLLMLMLLLLVAVRTL